MENIETSRNDDTSFKLLLNMLKDFHQGRARSVPEITLLEEFPTDVFLPVGRFNPRQIIENMMEKHRRTVQNVWKHPENLKTLVFTYEADSERDLISVTNNMEFYADIQTICFYFCRSLVHDTPNESIENIMEMMIHKYGIDIKSQMETLDLTAITLYSIAFSFPSITLEMFSYNVGGCHTVLHTMFKRYFPRLPVAIFFPIIFSVIPQLNDPPIAILTFIVLKLVDNSSPLHTKTPLCIIYRHVVTFYASTVFPERLQLQLCRRWGIVTVKENEYSFNPCFKKYREKAKKLISKIGALDPDLENILSRI